MRIEDIARVAHEANRAFCETLGDKSQVAFDDAPEWQRQSAMNGVQAIVDGRVQQPRDSHESWSKEKIEQGWKYGPVKDPEAKTHPCLVPFTQLPPEQQAKDHLFLAVVMALLATVGEPE